jgi:hypothetical protein
VLYHGPDINVILALVGATIIITRGVIFSRVQKLSHFFTCSLCVGFWVGAVSMFALRHGQGSASGHPFVWLWVVPDFFLDGATVALLSLAADAVLLRLLGDPSDKD